MKIASLRDRLIGFLIDYVLWSLITLIGYSLFSSNIVDNGIIIYSMIILPFLLKDITGQSPGKKMIKIKIVLKKATFKKPNTMLLILRSFFYFILLIDLPFIFFNSKRRRLVDILFGTIVVKEKNN